MNGGWHSLVRLVTRPPLWSRRGGLKYPERTLLPSKLYRAIPISGGGRMRPPPGTWHRPPHTKERNGGGRRERHAPPSTFYDLFVTWIQLFHLQYIRRLFPPPSLLETGAVCMAWLRLGFLLPRFLSLRPLWRACDLPLAQNGGVHIKWSSTDDDDDDDRVEGVRYMRRQVGRCVVDLATRRSP